MPSKDTQLRQRLRSLRSKGVLPGQRFGEGRVERRTAQDRLAGTLKILSSDSVSARDESKGGLPGFGGEFVGWKWAIADFVFVVAGGVAGRA